MKKVITFGEIMLRLSPPGFLRFSQATSLDVVYGGGEFNVAVSLANFNIPVSFVTRLPKNDIGESALSEIQKRGIDKEHVIFGGDRLGIYFLENGVASRGSKVVYDRAHSSMSEIQPSMVDWDEVLEGSNWFHWSGITPAISQSAADTCLEAVKAARKKRIKISTDLNYRSKLWNYGGNKEKIMSELLSYSDIVIGGEMDAFEYFGIRAENCDTIQVNDYAERQDSFESIAKQLIKAFPNIKQLYSNHRESLGADQNNWAGLAFDGSKIYTSSKYQINCIVDRVGTGDAFTAGIIYGSETYANDMQKTLEFAVAASCLKHSIKGDVNLARIEEVEKLIGGDTFGRVSR